MLKQKSNDKTKTKKTKHNVSVFMDSYKIQGPALTEGKRRGRKAQVDAAVIGNIRQTLSDEEGVLVVEMHHLLGWGRSARSEAAGRAGRFLLLELLLWAIHAKIWIGLLMLLTCELRSLHSVVGGDAGDYTGIGGVRCSRSGSRPSLCRCAGVVWVVLRLSGFLLSNNEPGDRYRRRASPPSLFLE